VTDALEATRTRSKTDTRAAVVVNDRGWYLYGITRLGDTGPKRGRGDRGEAEPTIGPQMNDGERVQVLACGDLAAVVRSVSLAEFGAEALRARLHDAAWLEAVVRSHNEVIAAIHQEQAILPSKFGCVYARAEDLTTALLQAHDALLAQLERLEGCDELGVHIYADRQAIQRRVVAEHPTMRQLQQELATASPGRAYFLKRKLTDEVARATEQVLSELAQAGYDHLVRRAVAGQANPTARPAGEGSGEKEILRAAFLVPRLSLDRFVAEVRSFAESQEGLRCESSGPWPPYSFAAPTV
jgi:hypothetical protein